MSHTSPPTRAIIDYMRDLSPDERREFASAVGTTEGYLRRAGYASRSLRLSLPLCIALERCSDGAIRCVDLRPDIDWHDLRDHLNRVLA